MATVYLAIQESFQREVALKVMSPSLAEDSEFSERFLREARIVSRLVHPNIVTVHDVGINNGHHYLSMEYVEGHDLKQCLPSLNGQQLLRVMQDMAKALDYAGKKGYVHRDVKPENIMLHDLDGRAVLMDFGIARAADAAVSMTRTGVALGTPHYMSPEQARGRSVDGRSDLYSLGVLFYYMLMGQVPFEAESPVAIGIKHISEVIPRLPAPLAEYQPLIDRLMAKKPGDRYQTGAELLTDLGKLDVAAMEAWRSRQALDYSDEQQPTPLRNESVELEGDFEFDPAAAHEGGGVDAQPELAFPEPDGALHIPQEDLEARITQQHSRGWLLKLLLFLIIVVGAGFYFYEALLPVVPKPVADLLLTVKQIVITQESEDTPAVNESGQGEVNVSDNAMATKRADQQALAGEGQTEADRQQQAQQSGQSSGQQSNAAGADVGDVGDVGIEINPIDKLLDSSRKLAERISEQPDRTQELIDLYREILALDAEHPETAEALAAIKENALLDISRQIDSNETEAAQQTLNTALLWFPELAGDERYQQHEQHVQTAVEVNRLLAEAEQYFAKDKLLYPVEANARQRYDAVLALSPEHSQAQHQAQQGLKKIAERYWVLAKKAQQQRDYPTAQTRIKKGLSVKPEHKKLLVLQKSVAKAIEREQAISTLLAEAVAFEQQQQWFGKGANAAQRYLAVQAIDRQRQEAANGLSRILERLYGQLDQLIASKEYDQAGAQIQAALLSFPDNDHLLSKLLELESYKPVIENIRLDGKSITASTAGRNVSQAKKVTVDRTLHVAFQYRNLDQPTTVLQVLLFDGGRSVQIAAAPVVVVGSEGDTQFRIDRSVEGFTDGGYHLDVLLGGQRIFSHAFVIDH